MKANFYNTVDILVKAYLNDTLQHGVCSACAVGNICLAAGAKHSRGEIDKGDNASWKWAFVTQNESGYNFRQIFNSPGSIDYKNALLVIEPTGYSVEQLAKIEWAFETANQGDSKEEYMFNGLMAVVDVLAEIHGINLEEKESAKKLFEKVIL